MEELKADCNVRERPEKEVEYLRSRIEQQSELICILKRKSDDYFEKSADLEQKVQMLKNEKDDAQTSATKSTKYLKHRFDQLSSNYDELVMIKDELKHRNKELTERNKKLTAENKTLFSKTLKEKTEEISQLQSHMKSMGTDFKSKEESLRSTVATLESTSSELCLKVELMEKQMTEKASKHKGQITSYQQQISELELAKEKMSTSQQHLLSEHDKLANEIVKLRKEYQIMVHKIDEAKAETMKEKESRRDAEKVKRKLDQDLSTNYHVRYLSEQVEALKSDNDRLTKEYETFKCYTRNLLEKEQSLNAKLRRMHLK